MSAFDVAKKYLQNDSNPVTEEPNSPVVDLVIDEIVAVLSDSTVLGAPIWFALREDWQPDPVDTTPVFYASELHLLRTKTPEQLREIFKTKRAFAGGKVVDPNAIDNSPPAAGSGRLELIVNRLNLSPTPPIEVAPGVKIVDANRFISITLADLQCYVTAKNEGRSIAWLELVDEKIARLRVCGIQAEIRTIQ